MRGFFHLRSLMSTAAQEHVRHLAKCVDPRSNLLEDRAEIREQGLYLGLGVPTAQSQLEGGFPTVGKLGSQMTEVTLVLHSHTRVHFNYTRCHKVGT